MLLYYIRHGQSENNALFDATGAELGRVKDPELTPTGIQQAAHLAKGVSQNQPFFRPQVFTGGGYGITHLYTSLMVRAITTAYPVAEALGLHLNGWTDLHEGGGIFLEDPKTGDMVGYPGGTRAELCERFPALVWPEGTPEDGWWNKPFESVPDRKLRARRVLAQLLARHGGTEDRVAFVSHGGFFYRFMCAVMDLDDPEGLWFSMYNTAISCIEFATDGSVAIRFQNHIQHLPEKLVT